MSRTRRLVPVLLAAALAVGLSGCGGGLRTEPTTSTLPAGAVAPTLPGASTSSVLGGQAGASPGTVGTSTTAGAGSSATTRAGQTTSTTGG